MASLQSLPPEIIYQMLSNMQESDIMKYCATHVEAMKICNDTVFWLNKLNQDFNTDTKFIASDYAIRYYPNESGHSIYKRWNQYMDNMKLFHDNPNMIRMNVDIIIFNLDQGYNDFLDEIRTGLFEYALIHNDYNMIKYVQTLNAEHLDNFEIAFSNIIHENLLTFEMIDMYETVMPLNTIVTNNSIDEICGIGRIDILEYLESKGILPNNNGSETAIANGYVPVVLWLKERNILPLVHGANLAAGQGNIYILNILRSWNILPNDNGIIDAISNRQSSSVSWFKQQGYDVSSPKIKAAVHTELKFRLRSHDI